MTIYASCSGDGVLARNYDEVFFDGPDGSEKKTFRK
jgi:hypothetical protein